MKPVFLQESHIISPIGIGTEENFLSVHQGISGIQPKTIHPVLGTTYIAQIEDSLLQDIFSSLALQEQSSRIEKMAIATLDPIVKNKKPIANSLLILSTTKANVQELSYNPQHGNNIPELAARLAKHFGFLNPPIVLSNACVSGVMALSLAKRYLQMGLCEEAYVLAFDEISVFIQSGFHAFQALSPEPCKPYDKDRKGLNLGEAAVACRVSLEKHPDSLRIAGDANINDANHISGPSRTGEGLYISITKALQEASLQPKDIEYIVAHGTATLYNDEMEATAFHRCGLSPIPVASYKANYGHTLGASGLLETVLMATCLRKGYLLPTKNFKDLGTSKAIHVLNDGLQKDISIALKTASGFAGTNTALILVKE